LFLDSHLVLLDIQAGGSGQMLPEK
jgi:hypothetical protein